MSALFGEARAADIVAVAKQLGSRIKRQGVEWIGPCPRCGGKDRFGINARKRVFHCRGCAVGGDVIDMVGMVLDLPPRQAAEHLAGRQIPSVPERPKPQTAAPTDHEAARTRQALAIFKEAIDPHATVVATYLERRGLELPDDPARVIRFHPACPFGGHRVLAMVALVSDIRTNEPRAIHRTALTPDGEKRVLVVNGKPECRLSLGPTSGGAIKLTPDEDLETGLGIGEGIESTLSMQAVPEFGRSPVWSAISKTGIAKFPVVAGVECLWIGVDNDAKGDGDKAARACRDAWCATKGKEVRRIRPRLGARQSGADREGREGRQKSEMQSRCSRGDLWLETGHFLQLCTVRKAVHTG